MSQGPIFTGGDLPDPDFDADLHDDAAIDRMAAAGGEPPLRKVFMLNSRSQAVEDVQDAVIRSEQSSAEAEQAAEAKPLSEVVPGVRAKAVGESAALYDLGPMDNVVGGIEAALARLPDADEETKRLAIDLLRQSMATEVAINPECLGTDEAAQIARHRVAMSTLDRFGKTWGDVIGQTGGRDQEMAMDIYKLVSTALSGHANRIQLALDNQKARDDLLKLAQANGQTEPAAPSTSNLVAQAITALWNAGSQTVKGALQGIKNLGEQGQKKVTAERFATENMREAGMVPKPTPSQVSTPVDPNASSSDVDMEQWRAKRLEDSLREAERLSEELALNAGDSDWEVSRGRELTEDLMKAIETVNSMADDNALDPDKIGATADRLQGIQQATSEAASRTVTDKMKEQVQAMAETIMNLVTKVKDRVKAIFGIESQPSELQTRGKVLEPTDDQSGPAQTNPMPHRAPRMT